MKKIHTHHIKIAIKTVCMICFLLFASCGEKEWGSEYSAAMQVKGKSVQMKIYGKYDGINEWNKVETEILDHITADHYPKKILIVVKRDGEEKDPDTNKIVTKIQKYLTKKGCRADVRDERK